MIRRKKQEKKFFSLLLDMIHLDHISKNLMRIKSQFVDCANKMKKHLICNSTFFFI